MNTLAVQIQNALAQAINSLKGTNHFGYADPYIGQMAVQVNRALIGFIQLHKEKYEDSARLLVRPALESAIKISALMTESQLIYRIAYGEIEEDKKWIKSLKGENSSGEQKLDADWAAFSTKYRNEFPQHTVRDAGLRIIDLAQKAGKPHLYQTYYRLYCRYTHGSLPAVSGSLEIDFETDDFTMKACALIALEAVIYLGGECSNFSGLEAEVAKEVRDRAS